MPKEKTELEVEIETLKIQKSYLKEKAEVYELTVKSEEHKAYIADLERRENYIKKWEANRDSKEKGLVAVHDEMVKGAEEKLRTAEELIGKLLGYISLGRISEYRDLDRRLNKTDLDTLEGVIKILREELEMAGVK